MMVEQAMELWNIEPDSEVEEQLRVCFDPDPNCRPLITDLQAHSCMMHSLQRIAIKSSLHRLSCVAK